MSSLSYIPGLVPVSWSDPRLSPLKLGGEYFSAIFLRKCLLISWLVLCLTSPLELGRKHFCDNFLRKIPWLVLCLGGHQLGLNVWDAEAPGAVVARVVASTTQRPGRVLKRHSALGTGILHSANLFLQCV
jgi:hypothetical protein